jgi:hypothetical protein
MARQRRDPEREAFWRGALKRFDGSGLTVRAFCQRERLTESAFYAWRRTIAQRDGKRRQRGTPGRPNFLPLRVTHHAAPDSSIMIVLAVPTTPAPRAWKLSAGCSASRCERSAVVSHQRADFGDSCPCPCRTAPQSAKTVQHTAIRRRVFETVVGSLIPIKTSSQQAPGRSSRL